MLRTGLIRCHKRKINIGFYCTRKFDLSFFPGFLKPLQRKLVLTKIDAVFLLKFVGKIVDDMLIKIFTTKKRVTISGFYLEDPISNF